MTQIGRPDLALEQARRGFAFGPGGPWDPWYSELADHLADAALARGDGQEALRVRAQAFRAAPGQAFYVQLHQAALDQGEWDQLRADTEAQMADQAPTEWVVVLLDQDRVDEAWQFAESAASKPGRGVWERLLSARGQVHPADVLPHYQTLVDASLVSTGRHYYESAGAWLVLLRGFAEAADQHDWFQAYLRQLWEGARRRPACREIFSRLGLVPGQ
ncbi:MAG: hypothetical protein FWH11_02090 [Micrococcales bacterium]|nr:hypothetical protein [Micrococcales bacterium]